MKHLMIAFLALTIFLFSCDNTTEIAPAFEANSELSEGTLIQTTSAELDKMIQKSGINASMSLQEKLEFLSDRIASDVTSNQTNSVNQTGQIVCVAQIFDGTNYTTRVDVGDASERAIASLRIDWRTPPAFIGANANIYLNGVNQSGRIDNAVNISCEFDAFARARANYNPFITSVSGRYSTNATVRCDD